MPQSDSAAFLSSLFSLDEKVAVVVGGTGELWGAMAEGLAGAAQRWSSSGGTRRTRRRGLRGLVRGRRAWFHPAEATRRTQLDGLLAAVLARSGSVDIVVNGAGVNSATPFFDIGEEESTGSCA